MSMTEHRFDSEIIKNLVAERQAALKANKNLSDFAGFALGVIDRRLQKDPKRYLDYGPYWPALKQLLIDSGRDYGNSSDWPLVSEVYRGETPAETIVMADEFRTLYLANTLVGTNRFQLDADGADELILFDEDMELA